MSTITFEDKVAIVTGAGNGIGRACAHELGRRGAKVVVNDYGGSTRGDDGGTEDSAGRVAEEIRSAGGQAVGNGTAVGSEQAAHEIRDQALSEFGKIDILVNAAGIVLYGGTTGLENEEIERLMTTNFMGAFHLMRSVWPIMESQKFGRIVNFSSSSALGFPELQVYGASKAALLALTTASSFEGEDCNIKVNCVMPLAAGRQLDSATHFPDDFANWFREKFPPALVAPGVAYLASEECKPNGEYFTLGGGRMSRLAFTVGDPHFDPELTVEGVAEHIDAIRDLSGGQPLTTANEEMEMYEDHIKNPFK